MEAASFEQTPSSPDVFLKTTSELVQEFYEIYCQLKRGLDRASTESSFQFFCFIRPFGFPSEMKLKTQASFEIIAFEFVLLVVNMYLIRRQPQTQQENGPSEREAKVCELRAALGPLSGRSLQFCTDSCLRRYLEARSWNVNKAKKIANFHDRYGRTVLIMRPGMQTTKCTEDNVRYMVYLLENGILNLADGQEQMSWLIDFTGWSLSTNIPIKTSRDCINVLQNHYPQRLAIAFLYNPPRIFEAFWKKVKFVYPKKKESLELMQSYFDIENLPSEFGGKASLEYDHEEFSRSMVEDDVRTAKFWGSVEKSRHVADDHLAQNHQENGHAEQEAKAIELRAALGPLSDRSVKYCTDACLKRYLTARNWNVDKAKKMLEETLKWRATYKPEEIRWHEVAHEGETGKVSRADFHDRSGRTVLIMRPGMQNTTCAEDNVRHLVYLIENSILNLGEGQEQMSWLIDFTGWGLSVKVPIKTARECINILQNHYPERLAVAFLFNPPRIFEAFWKVVKFFLDPITIQKVKFVYPKKEDSFELMKSFFDVDNLPNEFGGKASLMYDHEEFSRLMAQDDVKTAKFWGLDEKPSHISNGHSGAQVAPEPTPLAVPAS
uniref:CRAL-TRIO domain-containing protein n=1 Tax=Salix viminalis TaxID=40686 RepID=A0A6N2LAS6_SALVM